MVDKAKKIEKAETKSKSKASSKINTNSKTKTSTKTKTKSQTAGKKNRKPVDEVRKYRILGSRFTAEEYEYVKKMVKELKTVYKSQNKILLEITKEFVNSPLNNKILNRSGKIFLGKWSTIFGGNDIKKVLTAYLQLTRNLFPAPSKKCSKYNFVDFEMINKEGERFAIIVKSENDTINLEDFDNMMKKVKVKLKTYLFTTNGENQEFGDRDIEHIPLKDVFKLIEKYKVLLPVSIIKKIKMIDGIK
ncbi:hypothetical protein [uncultured Fusobacterium sp.]|uniref:hypothetical protein n=1 Tax=uncultured Fusobacterium sp. TaxID=159267 RepID=UPI0025D214C2|nr:hypothetical protein [uncultured Fusobacterium sp.]